jgi:hypothetical protein
MNDGTHSYKYDADGNLISADNGTPTVYAYDALDQRAESPALTKSTLLTEVNSGIEKRKS